MKATSNKSLQWTVRQQIAPILILALGIGIGATEAQTAYAQQSTDPRVADLVRTGKLRVGIGLGSPSGAMKNPETGELRGSDFTYLVPAGSPIHEVADADQPGIRIAVPRGDAVDLRLTRLLKKAELIRTNTLSDAVELVRTGGAHARAGPRQAVLAESVKLPGSRVLPDGFAVISSAASVPKGHAGRLAYISEFVEEAKASGLMKKMIEDAGLRGVQVAPE